MTEKEMLMTILGDMQEMKKDVKELKEDVNVLKEDVSGLKEDVSGLKDDVRGLKQDVKRIELTLENETNKNIKVIAEGHLDLARKLDEALKVENEREILLLRMNVLENDVRNIKESIA